MDDSLRPDSEEKTEARPSAPAGIGPMAGVIIIVLLILIGGVYFLFAENQRLHAPPAVEQINA